MGAAIGAGIGAGIYSSVKEAFTNLKMVKKVDPGEKVKIYDGLYNKWKNELLNFL